MISKARLKLIHSLEMRKYRQEHGLFVAEGPKLVGELMAKSSPVYVAALPEWLETNGASLPTTTDCDTLTPDELRRASLMQSPQMVVALFKMDNPQWDDNFARQNLCIALDGVQDPGNMGTICRLADWFGIEHIVCSRSCADIYNPKAVQATMGALARVNVHYTPLPQILRRAEVPVYGTFLDGEDIYNQTLQQHGFIVMGNEGKGISPEVEETVTARLYIPNYPRGRVTTESLNVAIATSIVCAEFRRRGQ